MSRLSVDIGWRADAARDGFGVEIAFEAGDGATVLFGPSGAGKTSILRCVAGLNRPSRGRIAFDDAVFFDAGAGVDLPPQARRVGMVFQEPRLFPHLSVRANLLYGAGSPDRLEEVAALLGVEALLARRPRALSGGEAQRVAIGRALLREPRLLLMDEPLANLDAARKAEVLPYLASLSARAGAPILYVTQSEAEAAALGARVIPVENGRIGG